MGTNDFRTPQNMDEWMREIEKRLQRQERRLGGVIGGTISDEGTPLRVPDPMAPIVPTDPPSASPEIHVQPSAHGFTVVTDNVEPSTTIDYYVDTVLMRSTRSTVEFFDTDPDGQPFTDVTVDHSFYVIARNEVGSADPSNSVIARIDPTIDDEFVRAVIEAGFVLAGMIQVGNITIRPSESHPGAGDSGIQIPLSNGGLISLPSDGTAAQFLRVVLQATQLLVEDKFELRGASNRIAGTLNLSTGVDTPVVTPTVSSVWPDPVLGPVGNSNGGNLRGLADGGTYWIAGVRGGVGPNSTSQIVAIDKTSGAQTVLVGGIGLGIDSSNKQVWNYTKMGTHHYVLVAAYGVVTGVYSIREFDATWTFVRSYDLPNFTNRFPQTLDNDGTDLFVGYPSVTSGDFSVLMLKVPATGTASRTNLIPNPSFETVDVSGWSLSDAATMAHTASTAGGAQVGTKAARLESLPTRQNLVIHPVSNAATYGATGWSPGTYCDSVTVAGTALRAAINGPAGWSAYVNGHNFLVTPGVQYTFSFTVVGWTNRSTQQVGFGALMRWYDINGNQIGGDDEGGYQGGFAPGLRYVRTGINPPAGAASVTVYIQTNTGGIIETGPWTFDFKEVAFEAYSTAQPNNYNFFSGASGTNYFWTGTAGHSPSVYHPPITVIDQTAKLTPVTPASQYTFSVYFKASLTARAITLKLIWYDASDVLISTSVAGTSPNDTTGGYTRFTMTDAAPATAAKVVAVVQVASVARGEYHYYDAALLEKASSAGTYFDGSTNTAGQIHSWAGTTGNSASSEYAATQVFVTPTSGANTIPTALIATYIGTADFGAKRFVLIYSGGAMVFDAAGAHVSTQDFTTNSLPVTGMVWDTATSRFFAMTYTALGAGSFTTSVYKLSPIVTSTSFSVAYSQYDSNPLGGTHETALSPAATITVTPRQFLKVLTAAPQGTGNQDEPDSIRHYIRTGGAGSYYRQPDVTAAPWTVLYGPPATTGATAPSTPDFAGLGNPGVIQSAKLDADGYPIWSMRGDGAVHMFPGEVRGFAGLIAPLGTLKCDGTSYLRATYPQLFGAITFTKTGSNGSASNVITMADTSNLALGMQVEAANIPNGATITGITPNTQITISANSTGSNLAGTVYRIIPHGAVDATHFNVPDYRGRTLVGIDGSTEFAGVGVKYGAKTVDLTHTHYVDHSHNGVDHLHGIFLSTSYAGSGNRTASNANATQGADRSLVTGTMNGRTNTDGPASSMAATNNVQPSAAVNWIIAW